MKILVTMPAVPYPVRGADAHDRFHGLMLLQELGHTVVVLSKMVAFHNPESSKHFSKALGGIEVHTVPYVDKRRLVSRIADPRWLDGASFEYTDPVMVSVFDQIIKSAKPDRVWLDYSSLWPLIQNSHLHNVGVVVRSANIESRHLLSDEGMNPRTLLSALGKELGERTLAQTADVVCSITPHESQYYTRVGAKHVFTLPLRGMPSILAEPQVHYQQRSPLHIVFSGAGYTVGHNLQAAQFVINKLSSRLYKNYPDDFVIHITGAKLPDALVSALPPNVRYEGYIQDYSTFMQNIDIALAPSFGGAGMQQKVFEPIARGIPTLTSKRAIAGYDFVVGDEVLTAESADEFIEQILSLQSSAQRKKIGEAGRAKSQKLFSKTALLQQMDSALSL